MGVVVVCLLQFLLLMVIEMVVDLPLELGLSQVEKARSEVKEAALESGLAGFQLLMGELKVDLARTRECNSKCMAHSSKENPSCSCKKYVIYITNH